MAPRYLGWQQATLALFLSFQEDILDNLLEHGNRHFVRQCLCLDSFGSSFSLVNPCSGVVPIHQFE